MNTFTNRHIFAIHHGSDKIVLTSTGLKSKVIWSYYFIRYATIPHTWAQRRQWVKVFELVFKLHDILLAQEDVSVQLEKERMGLSSVPKNETVHSQLF